MPHAVAPQSCRAWQTTFVDLPTHSCTHSKSPASRLQVRARSLKEMRAKQNAWRRQTLQRPWGKQHLYAQLPRLVPQGLSLDMSLSAGVGVRIRTTREKSKADATPKRRERILKLKVYSACYKLLFTVSSNMMRISCAHVCSSTTLFVQLLSPLLEVLLALRLGHVVRNGWAL